MRKLLGKIISKNFLTIFILLIELIILILISVFATFIFWYVEIIFRLFAIGTAIYIINSHAVNEYKISWLFFILVFPAFGILCYLLFANKKFTKKEEKQLEPILISMDLARESKYGASDIKDLNNEVDKDAFSIATYLEYYSGTNIYKNSEVTYYGWGEEGFPIMLEKLKAAKHYIFMEYFIIAPGKMWDSILKILKQKAKDGVDVRLLYDDFGCYKHFPRDYDKTLQSFGIKAYRVNKVRPMLDVRMNNRDHRKIMVIDGYVGFTGGINIADEYINEIVRFGKWKDNVIMIEGDAVFGLTSLFLSTYFAITKQKVESITFYDYLPKKYLHERSQKISGSGYVQPYGAIPYTEETVGVSVYINLLLKAKKYVYITTPYLILDEGMLGAITQCAKNGVKVKLITPHIPDKKNAFELTRSYYGALIRAGVEIYEFMPGFIHEKTFIVDGVMATVGTINLDYRSLYLHSENGTFLYKCKAIKDIERDFEMTLKESMFYSEKLYNQTPWYRHLYRSILRVIAPLF